MFWFVMRNFSSVVKGSVGKLWRSVPNSERVRFTVPLKEGKKTLDQDQSSYQVEWLSLIYFLRYWADMFFAFNGTVTLTFYLVTLKIYRGHLLTMTNLPTK